jgi:AcrR family transcriptional regulator
MRAVDTLAERRPRRADAARNFDAVLAAAREAFREAGLEASLEDVAKRAGVGIGTLYRNFPTRETLIDGVYATEVDALCEYALEVGSLEPWPAFVAWLGRFVELLGSKRAFVGQLSRESVPANASRDTLWRAAEPLLTRTQRAGDVRRRVEIDDVMRLIVGVSSVPFADDEQRDRCVAMVLDGIRAD